MVFAICLGAGGGSANGQDFGQLLDAVDKLEASLKALVGKESADRQLAIKRLEKTMENLRIQLKVPHGTEHSLDGIQLDSILSEITTLKLTVANMSANQEAGSLAPKLVEIVTEIAFLKAKCSALESSIHGNHGELASLDGDSYFPSFSPGSPSNGMAQTEAELSSKPADGRSRLEESGISFELVYTGELSSNVNGGVAQRSEYLENGDIVLSIDAEQLMNWRGASFSFYVLGDRGGSPSENIGDMQTASNIDADDTWKLYEAWYQQNLASDRLSFLFGLYDLNSEFDAIETAGLFLNSSFGIGPDYSQSGQNGPSIFPSTSLALRTRVQLSQSVYVQTAALDGVSGDPDNPSGTQIKFGHGDGVLIATEIGYLTGTSEDSDAPYSKYALGTWVYSAKFDDILEVDGSGDPTRHSGNSGLYLFGEQTVYRKQDPSHNLALFARIGFANTRINQIGSYIGGGIVASGLIFGRDEDQFGLAVAAAFNGSRFKQAQRDAGSPVDGAEITFELSYSSQILPQLIIHPDLQYVINPGTNPGVKNALVLGTRFELTF